MVIMDRSYILITSVRYGYYWSIQLCLLSKQSCLGFAVWNFPRFVLQMGGRCSLSSETAVDNKWILIVKPPEQWDKSEPLLGDLCTVREQYVIRISSCKISFIFRVFRKKPPAKRKRLPRQQRHQRFTGQELENILNRSQRQGMIGYIRLTLFFGKLSSFSFVKISEGSLGVQGCLSA